MDVLEYKIARDADANLSRVSYNSILNINMVTITCKTRKEKCLYVLNY